MSNEQQRALRRQAVVEATESFVLSPATIKSYEATVRTFKQFLLTEMIKVENESDLASLDESIRRTRYRDDDGDGIFIMCDGFLEPVTLYFLPIILTSQTETPPPVGMRDEDGVNIRLDILPIWVFVNFLVSAERKDGSNLYLGADRSRVQP